MTTKSHSFRSSVARVGLDTGAALVAFLVGVALLISYSSASTILTVMIPLAITTASSLYLFTQWSGAETPAIEQLEVSGRIGYALFLTTIVGLAAMVFLGTYTGGRTVPFFGVATFVYLLVFMQIFFTEKSRLRPARILAVILVFTGILRGVALFTTPGFIGVDVWVHMNYIEAISRDGSLGAIADSKYFGAPLYHLLVVTTADAFNSSFRTALYTTVGVIPSLSVLFIFYASKNVLPTRWALFATALFAIADRFVLWGIHLIPTSMGLVFFLGIFYGTARIYWTDARWMYALVFLFGLATVLTHQISTAIILVFLGAGTLAQLSAWLLADRIGVWQSLQSDGSVNFFALFAVMVPLTIVDWSISPPGDSSFLSAMITRAVTRISSPGSFSAEGWGSTQAAPIEGLLTVAPLSVQIIFTLGLSVLLMIGLIGMFAVLRRQQLNLVILAWVISSGLMLFVVFAMPLLGMEFLIPGRWTAFMYVPLVVLGALGLWHVNVRATPRQAVVVLFVFTLLFTAPMLTNHKAAIEEPVFEDYQLTPAYSESELEAAQTIATIHQRDTTVDADRPYYLLLRDRHQMSPRPDMLTLTADGTVTGEYTVYRDEITEQSTIARFEGRTVRVTLPFDAVCRSGMEIDYSNGDVRYCTT